MVAGNSCRTSARFVGLFSRRTGYHVTNPETGRMMVPPGDQGGTGHREVQCCVVGTRELRSWGRVSLSSREKAIITRTENNHNTTNSNRRTTGVSKRRCVPRKSSAMLPGKQATKVGCQSGPPRYVERFGFDKPKKLLCPAAQQQQAQLSSETGGMQVCTSTGRSLG